MPPEGQSCATCLFWLARFPGHEKTTGPRGLCRRYAPRPTTTANTAGVTYDNACWPLTQADDYCGEWCRASLAQQT